MATCDNKDRQPHNCITNPPAGMVLTEGATKLHQVLSSVDPLCNELNGLFHLD